MKQLDKNIKRKYTISDYNPEWIHQFEVIKEKLQKIFGDKAVQIEHIGSTSITGMKAKPTIDVLLVVEKIQDLEKEKEEMVRSGYDWGENYIAPNTLIFFLVGPDGEKLENIHVCEIGAPRIKQFLVKRDFFKTFPNKAKEYSDLKEKNFKLYPDDYPAYREAKAPFLEKIEQEAYVWGESGRNAPKEILEKVFQEYEKTLVIPIDKPLPQWILMPVGLMSSGKTTTVTLLADHFKLIRISTDEVRKRLKERGYSYEGCREIVYDMGQKYLKLGYSIAIDANTGSEEGVKYAQKTKEIFPSIPQIFIHVNPPVEFIVEKLQNYKTWLFKSKEHAIERFYFHKNNLKLPDVPFVYTFDPSKGNFQEQIEEGIAAIENALRTK